MRILFICPYPIGEAPSQRFRFEQYFVLLNQQQITYRVQSFLTTDNWRIFYERGKPIQKILALIAGYVKRILLLFSIHQFGFVFIHRESTPLGPPFFEWVLAKIFRKKIIYDFDDAIWLTDQPDASVFIKILKWRSKVSTICRLSYRVSAGNEYLSNYAARYAGTVIYNPSTLDVDHLHNPELHTPIKDANRVVIGWTGSHSTMKYLESIEDELIELEQKFPQLLLLVISNQRPKLRLKNLRFLPWSLETEIEGLMHADIGIMPMPDDDWAKGKCGFKALQYMALQIPAVVSAVGSNKFIVAHGDDGFLCYTPQDWVNFLSQLISDSDLRTQIGKKGREKILKQFSVESNQDNFLSLFGFPRSTRANAK